MPDYAAMYRRLFRSQTKAIEILQEAQQAAEEMYISSPDPDIRVLSRPEDSNIPKLTEQDLSNLIGVNIDGYVIEKARIKRGELSDSDHYGIALAKNEAGHYVTWQFHLLEDGFPVAYWGHYFNNDYGGALSDFESRE